MKVEDKARERSSFCSFDFLLYFFFYLKVSINIISEMPEHLSLTIIILTWISSRDWNSFYVFIPGDTEQERFWLIENRIIKNFSSRGQICFLPRDRKPIGYLLKKKAERRAIGMWMVWAAMPGGQLRPPVVCHSMVKALQSQPFQPTSP